MQVKDSLVQQITLESGQMTYIKDNQKYIQIYHITG